MFKHKFKNPKVNNQYRKPACHTDYCFQRRACCNNYRCCVCHCCLDDFKIYSPEHGSCIANVTYTGTSEETVPKTAPTPRGATVEQAETQRNAGKRRRTFASTVTEKSFLLPTKASDVLLKTEKTWTESTSYTTEVKTTFQAWKPTINKSNSKGRVGYSQVVRDDKTSTIAGVAVALALVAIVAIVIVVVVCSRKKRQKRSKTPKPDTSGNETAIVTTPLTIENVCDKLRDGASGSSVSDTTLDSNHVFLKTAGKSSKRERSRADQHHHHHYLHDHHRGDAPHRSCNGAILASNGTTAMLLKHEKEAHLNNFRHPAYTLKPQQNGHHLQVRNGSIECDV